MFVSDLLFEFSHASINFAQILTKLGRFRLLPSVDPAYPIGLSQA